MVYIMSFNLWIFEWKINKSNQIKSNQINIICLISDKSIFKHISFSVEHAEYICLTSSVSVSAHMSGAVNELASQGDCRMTFSGGPFLKLDSLFCRCWLLIRLWGMPFYDRNYGICFKRPCLYKYPSIHQM